jgi:hypothetical protein
VSINQAEYKEILRRLAPCGLNCGKCLFYFDGEIRELSIKLKDRLGNFGSYAERFAKGAAVFNNYKGFNELLSFMTTGDCQGCREGGCMFPGCNVNNCTSSKNIDFCFQCEEFPCKKSNLHGTLKERWINMNSRMKEIGASEYYKETADEPRYV